MWGFQIQALYNSEVIMSGRANQPCCEEEHWQHECHITMWLCTHVVHYIVVQIGLHSGCRDSSWTGGGSGSPCSGSHPVDGHSGQEKVHTYWVTGPARIEPWSLKVLEISRDEWDLLWAFSVEATRGDLWQTAEKNFLIKKGKRKERIRLSFWRFSKPSPGHMIVTRLYWLYFACH